MRELIKRCIMEAIRSLQESEGVHFTMPDVTIERPKELSHGDWTTNIAFVLAKKMKKTPYDVADQLSKMIAENDHIDQIHAVQPGYINITLSSNFSKEEIKKIIDQKEGYGMNDLLSGQKIMVEYTQPNPFKPFHIGHLMSNTIGESISCIVDFSGADVMRANYQGDVGPHVAKALWGLQKLGYEPTDVDKIGEAYAYGHNASEADENAKKEIESINASVYRKDNPDLMEMYEKGRKKTLERFEELYAILGTSFDQYFFESETWQKGEEIVREHIGDIFEESDGAIIFKGEKHGLHTRVFITRQGLPTYEAKELGLAFLKKETCAVDRYIITTAVEQEEYFKVVKKVIELVDPSLEGKIMHIAHGMMQLASGKMSSRKGNVITGESLIEDAQNVAEEKMSERVADCHENDNITNAIAVAGIKFSVLKQRSGKNIVFDPETALSFDGDSGPYIQYTYARCRSILRNAQEKSIEPSFEDLDADGRDLPRILVQFPEVVEHAGVEYASHYIANYLLELAHVFNTYYAVHVIIDEGERDRSASRIALTAATAQVIKNGMNLLGIRVPEKM
jgi:arginyl-tRNA synthetase